MMSLVVTYLLSFPTVCLGHDPGLNCVSFRDFSFLFFSLEIIGTSHLDYTIDFD